MSNILSRIQEIALNEGITIGAFEKRIGASKGVLSRAINNGTDIQSKWIQNIVENYPRYSTRWLLTGKGPMVCNSSNLNNDSLLHASSAMPILSMHNHEDNFISIPLVEISVAAGCGGYDNPSHLDVVNEIKMPSTMVKSNGQYFCVRVKGESMTPTILDSSYIIARLLDRSEWADMPERHIYIVSDREGHAYIKRVKNRLDNSGFIVCMSDNVDKVNYPNFNLESQDINTILHAEWYFSAKMPNLNETYYDKVNQLEDKYDELENQMKQILRAINSK